MNSGHGKRNAYTTDFKIKVLEHYMKNGGEKVFGLKAKTALHFNIGKKTVHRIVESKQDLLRAKATKTKKAVTPAAKPVVSNPASKAVCSKTVIHKAVAPKTVFGNKIVTAVKTTINNPNASPAKHTSLPPKAVTAAPSNKTSVLASKPPTSSLSKTNTGKTTTSKETPSIGLHINDEDETSQSYEEEVLDLPEDPDFSILKLPIAGGVAATGVAGPAMLLSTATDEVRHALVHECELLYECRVCRNLFRSVVNFLAHKRIFCTQHYSENRSLYPEGQASQFTPHSNTVINETDSSSEGKCGVRVSHRRGTASQPSSARYTGSSEYYTRLAGLERERAAHSKDCDLTLQGIADSNSAVYQSFLHPDQSAPSQRGREMVRIHEHGVMAILNEHGAVASTVSLDGSGQHTSVAMETEYDSQSAPEVKTEMEEEEEEEEMEELEDEEEEGEGEEIGKDGSFVCTECGRIFAGAKYLRTHLKNVHGAERTVFSCPICDNKFLSLWTTGKHLQKSHNKTKSQIDHLRNTIKKNSYKEKNVRVPSKAASKAKPDVLLNNNNNNNNNDGKNEDSGLDANVEIKKEIDDEALEKEVVEGTAAIGQFTSSSSSKPGSATKAPLGDGGEEEDDVVGMMGAVAQKGMVLSRRWMCNVCRKLHVTHTASLDHAATHTDCTFFPKPQLVQVILNRKAFSKPILPPSSYSTSPAVNSSADGVQKQNSSLEGPGDLVLPDSVLSIEDHANVSRLNTGTVVTTISSVNESSVQGANSLSVSNGIIDIPDDDSPMAEIEVTASHSSNVATTRKTVPTLSDNVAFTISRTNNLSWRESNIPFQSMDQKSALERSIERIYQRQKGSSEPKVHEIMLQRRQSIKNINKDSTTSLQSQRSASGAAATGRDVRGSGTISPSKRKLNLALSSYATKISKLSHNDAIHGSPQRKSSINALSFTGLIGGKVSSGSKVGQPVSSPIRVNQKASHVIFTSFTGGKSLTMPVSASQYLPSTSGISTVDQDVIFVTAPSATKPISSLPVAKINSTNKETVFKDKSVSHNPNDTLKQRVKSPQPTPSKSASVSQQENDSSKSKAWSIFEADWDDDEDDDDTELLGLGITGQGTKSPELPDITGGKTNDPVEVCGTSRVLSPDDCSSRKNELVKTPDSVPSSLSSSTWNKSNSYDHKVTSNTPSVRSEDISNDSCSSSIVSINEEKTKYEHSGNSIQGAQEEASSTTKEETPRSTKGMELKGLVKQLEEPGSAGISKRSVRQRNMKTVDESALTFKLKSHFSHFIEQRASSVILDRRKTGNDSSKAAQSNPSRKHFAGLLDRSAMSRHGKSDSTFQSFNKTTSSGQRSLLSQPVASSTVKKTQLPSKIPPNDEDVDMKLFDCGSMAEQAYDATKDSVSSSSKSPDVLEIGPETECSSVTDTCVTSDTALPASARACQSDTVLTTASNLGLFDTGFEECRLHVVDDRATREEATQDAQDTGVNAGPSRIASAHR